MKHGRAFPAEPRSVTAARKFAAAALPPGSEEVSNAVELMVSELATNAVRHVQTEFTVTVRVGDDIRVEVTDHGGGEPVMRSPGPDEPTGRGLRIVDMFADRWGVEHHRAGGKTVWFSLAAAPATDVPVLRHRSEGHPAG